VSGGKYRTIVVDPPWQVHQPPMRYETGVAPPKGEPNRPLPYPTMSADEIAALPVDDLADENCHLYLWTINRYVEDAYIICREWGFNPSTLLTWCKAPMGMGPGGAYALTAEFCLFARQGKGAFETRQDRSWWEWPRGRHSAKPDAFLDIVERVSPGPYVELFARRARFGWDYWGNESLGTASMEEAA